MFGHFSTSTTNNTLMWVKEHQKQSPSQFWLPSVAQKCKHSENGEKGRGGGGGGVGGGGGGGQTLAFHFSSELQNNVQLRYKVSHLHILPPNPVLLLSFFMHCFLEISIKAQNLYNFHKLMNKSLAIKFSL